MQLDFKIDHNDLLTEVKAGIAESGEIRDFIQLNADTAFKGFYVSTITENNGTMTFKFKEKGKLSRTYVVKNQRDLDKYTNIFYFRYLAARQFINVNLYKLCDEYVKQRKLAKAFNGTQTVPVWLASGDMTVSTEDTPYAYKIIFNDNPNMTTVVTGESTLRNNRHKNSLHEAVGFMCRYIFKAAKTEEEVRQVEDLLTEVIFSGHQYLLSDLLSDRAVEEDMRNV